MTTPHRTLQEAAQMALDALLIGYHRGTHDAIAALREALNAPEPEPVALESVHLTRDTRGMCVVRVNGRLAIRDNGDIIDHMATLEWFAAPPAAVSAAKDAEIAALRADFTALQRAIVGDTGASAILEAGRLRAEVAGLRAELLKSLADNAALRERVKVLEDALRGMVIANERHSFLRVGDALTAARAALEQKP